MPLASMPVGTIVHNVELKPGKGGQIARSAGTYAQLVGRDQGMAILRLNSGEQRLVPVPASLRSVQCPTRTTATSTTVRPVVRCGVASVRTFAALQ